jgi:cell division protein FtsZ
LVRSISDIIAKPGHINVDFADVRAIMKDRGLAVMGTGRASGQNRAAEATLHAISSPLLENMSITGAKGILFNITGGVRLSLHEIHEAASLIYQEAHEDATIIIGSVIDETLDDEVIVTIIATGFDAIVPQQATSAIDDAKASHLLAEETVRAAHELVDALKAETERAKTVSVTQPALRDDEFMRAIVQEVLREVKQTEKTEISAQPNNETQETQKSATVTVQKDEPLSASEHPIMVDINDLDVPAYLRQEAMQEQK